MKRRILIVMLLFAAAAQAQSDPWAALRVFEGKWEGTVTGKPGKQISHREYHFEYDGKFLSQRDDSVYQPQSSSDRSGNRGDFGVFSYDAVQKKIVWRQFHSEGFVNEYTRDSVSADGKAFEFVTYRIENFPGGRAKKSYRVISASEIEETFYLAPPGKDLEVYTVARLTRVK